MLHTRIQTKNPIYIYLPKAEWKGGDVVAVLLGLLKIPVFVIGYPAIGVLDTGLVAGMFIGDMKDMGAAGADVVANWFMEGALFLGLPDSERLSMFMLSPPTLLHVLPVLTG